MAVRFDTDAPYEVVETDEVFARPAGRDLLARVYRPQGDARGLGALVDVHGGAWNRGDRLVGALHCRALAACGLVVASVDFRQGPDDQHPAASADVAAGVRWVRAHAARLGVDPRRVGVVGSSSGGQLALLLAVRPGAPEHTGTPALRPEGTLDGGAGDDTEAFVLALYPVADPLARYRYVLGREHEPPPDSGFDAKRLIASHRAYFTGEDAMAAASVTARLTAAETGARPPAWIAQPELDDNVPAAITDDFVRAYEKAGGTIERVRVPGARHGFIVQASADTDKTIALMRDWIGRQLARR